MIRSIFKNYGLRSKSLFVLTILLFAVVKISMAQVTHRWNPTVGGPNFPWSNAANWIDPSTGSPPAAAPGGASIVLFNAGNTTCLLTFNPLCPGCPAIGVRGLSISGFTGNINLNGRTLQVNPLVAADLSISTTATINGPGTFTINSVNVPVTITGIKTSATAATNLVVSSAGVGVSVNSSSFPSVFNGSFTVNAPDNIVFIGVTFNGATTINKTGATNYTLTGLSAANTFPGSPTTVTIRNSGAGNFIHTIETFNNPLALVVENTGGGTLTVDNFTFNNSVTVTHNLAGAVTVDQATTNSSLVVNNNSAGMLTVDRSTFSNSVTANNTNTGTLTVDRPTFSGSVTANNNSTGILMIDRATITNTVTINQAGNGQMYLGSATGNFTLQSGATFTTTGFTNGRLYFRNFVQLGAIAQNIAFTNGGATTPVVYLESGTIFNSDLTFSAPKIVFNGTTFNGSTNTFTQNNTLNTSPYRNDVSVGANVFNGTTTITNSGYGKILLDGNNTFNSNVTIVNSSNNLNASIVMGYDAASTGTLTDVYNGIVTIQSTGSNSIDMAYNVASQFNNNITTSCTGGCLSIGFGAANGTATLANGKTIVAGGGGFSTGQLILNGFTQVGSTSQNITLTGTALLRASENLAATPTTFNGSVNFTAPAFNIGKAVFNGITTMTKTANVADSWAGGSTFNADVSLINSGTACMACPSTVPDTFNGNLSVTKGSSVSALSNSKLAGNLTASSPDVNTFMLGRIEFIGNALQTINKGSGSPFTGIDFSDITLNKMGAARVTIMGFISIFVSGSATFTNGILVTNGGDVTFSGSVSGGSNVSFVDGMAKRDLSSSGPFTFPTGDKNAGVYRPVTLSPEAGGFGCYYSKTTPPDVTSLVGLQNVSLCECWGIQHFSPPDVSVTLSWVSADCYNPASGYVNNLSLLRVAYYNGQWRDKGNAGTTGTTAAGTITSDLSSYNAPGFWGGLFTLGSDNSSQDPLLPIELSEFSGEHTPSGVVLNWETESEINNNLFEIEHAGSELDFEKIGAVPGHGTTHAQNTYSWLDHDPLVGVSYYRLRQVDFDGQSTYSKIISVRTENEDSKFSVYPNPAKDVLRFSSTVNAVVYDCKGNMMTKVWGANEIDLKGFSPGIYIIKTMNGKSQRFVVK